MSFTTIFQNKAQQKSVVAEQERSKMTAADLRELGEPGQYHSDKIVTGSVNSATITRKVKEVASGSRALCKVKKGGEEFLQKMGQNVTINVQSYAHKSFWEKL